MTTSMLLALMLQQASGRIDSPLDYDPDLKLFLDSEENVVLSGSNVISWGDDDPQNATTVFDVPTGGLSPVNVADASNGFPGIDFQESPPVNGFLGRKLTASASNIDDFWARTGSQSMSFAAKWVKQTDTRFSTSSTLISKGFNAPQTSPPGRGWRLRIRPTSGSSTLGDLVFEAGRSDGSSWTLTALGFFTVGDLVLGSVTYDGSNTSGGGFFRLYDKTQDAFVNVGSATLGTTNALGLDTSDECVIGNVRDPANSDVNAPFEGQIMSLWAVEGANNFGDDLYLRRYIP